jgi:putative ABC transport system permease protein
MMTVANRTPKYVAKARSLIESSADKPTVLVGLENRFAAFTLQRQLNNFKDDRLIAVLLEVAMTQLWQLMGNIDWWLCILTYRG